MMTAAFTPDLIRGVAEIEALETGVRLHRLPAWVREQFPEPQLLSVEAQPSGVRLVFTTAANTVELVSHSKRSAYRGAERPRGCIDVFVNGRFVSRDVLDGGDVTELDLATGTTPFVAGPAHTTTLSELPPGDNRVELWLPHNESIDLIELRGNAPMLAVPSTSPQWVHHGSSISHGSNAAAPSEIWPAVAARAAGVELLNLGFGGSALVDPFLSRVVRDAPADFISVKLGINVVNFDAMRLRAFVPAVHGFLDTIRDGHPETPLVLISPIFCGIHEDTPGPGAVDVSTLGADQVKFIATGKPEDQQQGRLTLKVIRRELEALVERRRADPNLHYLDGTSLYGADDATELPLPDNLHPGPDAHRRIGERFAAYAFADSGPFSSAPAERGPKGTHA